MTHRVLPAIGCSPEVGEMLAKNKNETVSTTIHDLHTINDMHIYIGMYVRI